jgi:hypothetical protein
MPCLSLISYRILRLSLRQSRAYDESYRRGSARADHEFADHWLGELRSVAKSREQIVGRAASEGARGKFEVFGDQVESLEEGADFLEYEAVGKVAVRLTLPRKSARDDKDNWRPIGAGAATCSLQERNVVSGFLGEPLEAM